MKVLTVKSVESISDDLQNEIHHTFGMEHHTDYVFKDKGGEIYSATISLEKTGHVIEEIIRQSKKFPEMIFIVDNLDSDNSIIERYRIKDGSKIEHLKSNLEWKVS